MTISAIVAYWRKGIPSWTKHSPPRQQGAGQISGMRTTFADSNSLAMVVLECLSSTSSWPASLQSTVSVLAVDFRFQCRALSASSDPSCRVVKGGLNAPVTMAAGASSFRWERPCEVAGAGRTLTSSSCYRAGLCFPNYARRFGIRPQPMQVLLPALRQAVKP